MALRMAWCGDKNSKLEDFKIPWGPSEPVPGGLTAEQVAAGNKAIAALHESQDATVVRISKAEAAARNPFLRRG